MIRTRRIIEEAGTSADFKRCTPVSSTRQGVFGFKGCGAAIFSRFGRGS